MALIETIQLKNFRNYESAKFQFSRGINHIYGPNGLGKTNLLEAIFLLSTGRSFKTINLSELIKHGEKEFLIEATFIKDEIEQKISIAYDKIQKRIYHNGTAYSTFTELLGLLPSVVYSPLDIFLISGQPSSRRRFLDLHIAQKDPIYVYHLGRYHRALKHRNALLKRREIRFIEIWEEEMKKSAVEIVKIRERALTELDTLLKKEMKSISNSTKEPSLIYEPSKIPSKDIREKELLFGYTLFGPHRDDITLQLEGKPAKLFASEGEKRILIAALKLAAYEHLEFPLFAIDDFGNHLDSDKSLLLEARLKEFPQVFITSPDSMPLSTEVYAVCL